MAENGNSDVDRLLGCFRRGVAQRNHDSKELRRTPLKRLNSRHVDTLSAAESSFENVHTPQGKEFLLANNFTAADTTLKKIRSVCKQISPGVFYGSPLGKPARKTPQLLCFLNDIRRDLAGLSHLRKAEFADESLQASRARASIWATFPRQEQAMQFAESNVEENLVVFQYQDHINGQRRFLAATYEEFWHRYTGMAANYRHHYEIIQEGKPCHLYFDLEFNRRANSEADGEAMVDILLSVVSRAFLDIFDLQYDPSWTLELDSSTEDKFSRHLIIHAPRTAFKNNMHAGSFVAEENSSPEGQQ